MPKNELILASKDLQEAGISAQLNSNDLIEVVALEIFKKFEESIVSYQKDDSDLRKEYDKLMLPEYEAFEQALYKAGIFTKSEKSKLKFFRNLEDPEEKYWVPVTLCTIVVEEKNNGTHIKEGTWNGFNLPDLKKRTASVVLNLTEETTVVNESSKIPGVKQKIVNKTEYNFSKSVTVPIARFKEFQESVKAHNARVKEFLETLPKTGLISVDRFTREARVKLNKKMLSAQSPDFKKKIAELFGVTLD